MTIAKDTKAAIIDLPDISLEVLNSSISDHNDININKSSSKKQIK